MGEVAVTGPAHRRRRFAKTGGASLAGGLTLALLLVWAQPGAARPRRVEGGGSFAEAPVITEGSYRDTIRPTETLYYAVELGPGQRLRARVVLRPHGDEGSDVPRLAVYDPGRAEISEDITDFNYLLTAVLRAGKPEVFSQGSYESPGTYYVSFSLPNQNGNLRRRSIYDFALEIDVRGQALTTPSPTPTITYSPSPSPEPSPTAAEPPAEKSEGAEPYLWTGTIGLVLGAVLGAARRLLWG